LYEEKLLSSGDYVIHKKFSQALHCLDMEQARYSISKGIPFVSHIFLISSTRVSLSGIKDIDI
jgi:hypothetical protein